MPSESRPPRWAGAQNQKIRGGGTPLDLFIFRRRPTEDSPLIVFQHIRKTAGTSIRHAMEGNLRGTRRIFLDAPKQNSDEDIRGWYESVWSRLRIGERARVAAVASHSANYLLEVADRPTRAFTMLRDPIDRVLSRYHFFGREKRWSLPEYYAASTPGDANPEFFNGAARSILEPHYDMTQFPATIGPPIDADVWRSRLWTIISKHYVIGLQDRFIESMRLFGREFGWTRLLVPAMRVNATRPLAHELSQEELATISAANWLDVELFAHATAAFDHAMTSFGQPPAEGEDKLESAVPTRMTELTPGAIAAHAVLAHVYNLEQRLRTAEKALSAAGISAPEIPRKRRLMRAETLENLPSSSDEAEGGTEGDSSSGTESGTEAETRDNT